VSDHSFLEPPSPDPDDPDDPRHRYRDHIIITKHVPLELELQQADGKQTVGARLIRPFPEARILFIDHTDMLFYVYWIDHRLMLPKRQWSLD